MAQLQLSDLYYKLDAKLKAWYTEKDSFIKGEDPYAMNKAEFSQDMSHLPSLGYVYYCWLTVGICSLHYTAFQYPYYLIVFARYLMVMFYYPAVTVPRYHCVSFVHN